jgi:hypothetical protein
MLPLSIPLTTAPRVSLPLRAMPRSVSTAKLRVLPLWQSREEYENDLEEMSASADDHAA